MLGVYSIHTQIYVYIFCINIHVHAVAIVVLSFAHRFCVLYWMSRASAQYCFACRRKHRSELWYGTSDFPYCGTSYSRMFRHGCRVCHPSWAVYEDCAYESDETGARICAAVYRKDAAAICEGAILMSSSMLEPRMRVLVSLLASTYYYPWPSHAFILRIVGLACKVPSRASLVRSGWLGHG